MNNLTINIIKEGEMDGKCRKNGTDEKRMYHFSLKTWKDHLGDTDVGGRIILKWLLKRIGYQCVDWILIHQDGDQRWAPLNMVIYLRVP